MGPDRLFAVITFATGALMLLGWAYQTTDNPRSNRMLAKSLILFVLPGTAIAALPDSIFLFPFSMWVLIFAEECLKAFAARTEVRPLDRFWLVALFGIWELMLAKPIWGLTIGETFSDWDRLELLGLTAAAGVAVLMHAVTAAVYAFHFEGRLWAAFISSWAIHTVFNELVGLFDPSLLASGIVAFFLAMLLAGLWPNSEVKDSVKGLP